MLNPMEPAVLLTLDTRDNSPLLDSRWLLKTIGIDSPEEMFTQVHLIKAVHNLVPVALKGRETAKSHCLNCSETFG